MDTDPVGVMLRQRPPIFCVYLFLRYVHRNDEVGEIQNVLWQRGLDVKKISPLKCCMKI